MIMETYYSYLLKEGIYIIGDPLYFITSYRWKQALLDNAGFKHKPHGNIIDDKNESHQIIVFGSQIGTGTYYDNKNNMYQNKSGYFAIIEKSLKDFPKYNNCHIFNFTDPFYVADYHGNLIFGKICINILQRASKPHFLEEMIA